MVAASGFMSVKPGPANVDFVRIGRGLQAALLFSEAGGLARDSTMLSSLGAHGTLQTGVTFQERGAFAGGCANFSGASTSRITCGAGTRVANLRPVTVLCWINASSPTNTILVDKSAGDTGIGFFWGFDSNGSINFVGSTSGSDVWALSTTTPAANRWTQIAATWTNSLTASNIILYQNGRAIASTTTQNGTGSVGSDSAQPLKIGGLSSSATISSSANWAASSTYNLTGMIDHVLLWNRVLSPGEISALYREPFAFTLGQKPVSPRLGSSGSAFTGTASDAPASSDTTTRVYVGGRSPTDAPTSSDAGTRTGVFTRSNTDSPTSSDAATGIKTFPRSATDSPLSSDGATRTQVLARSGSDSPASADAATRAEVLARSLTDSPLSSDTASRTEVLARSSSDAPASGDNATRLQVLARSVTASPTSSDTAARAPIAFVRTTLDNPTSSDAVIRVFTGVRTEADSPSSSDTVTRTLVEARAGTDSPTSSDGVSRAFAGTRSSTDSPASSELVSTSFGGSRTTTDSPASSDTVSRLGTFIRTTIDDPSSNDTATGTKGSNSRSAVDSPTSSDTATRSLVEARSGTDTPTSSDLATRSLSEIRMGSDSPTTTDSLARAVSQVRSVLDTPLSADVATRLGTFARNTTDTPTSSDSAGRFVIFARAANDVILFADSTVRAVIGARYAADFPTSADVATVPSRPLIAEKIWTEGARDILWVENTRVITWQESTRILVWAGGIKVLTLISRTGESAVYAYDFSNDAVVRAGDTIAAVTSVLATANNGAAIGEAPTIGTPVISGNQILVVIAGPATSGAEYLVRFKIVTTGGMTRVGQGLYSVSDE